MIAHLCECGCGEPTHRYTQNHSIRKYMKGQYARFRQGHHGFGRTKLATPIATQLPSMVDLAWAAGFLEGEGSFYSQRRGSHVAATQKEKEPLERLQALFGGNIRIENKKRGFSNYRWTTSGPRARGIAMTIYGFMSNRRKEQIKTALKPLTPSVL